ncbi:hypothetical protein GE09DRAFT_100288 [Coniochaeta sp. 2T2.1]|nr:hypothetical protein GE09DRAFT_100288 [Coniochaeta sp. 2T2.1]
MASFALVPSVIDSISSTSSLLFLSPRSLRGSSSYTQQLISALSPVVITDIAPEPRLDLQCPHHGRHSKPSSSSIPRTGPARMIIAPYGSNMFVHGTFLSTAEIRLLQITSHLVCRMSTSLGTITNMKRSKPSQACRIREGTGRLLPLLPRLSKSTLACSKHTRHQTPCLVRKGRTCPQCCSSRCWSEDFSKRQCHCTYIHWSLRPACHPSSVSGQSLDSTSPCRPSTTG